MECGISRGCILLLLIVFLKSDCGNRILVVLVCRLLSPTSIVDLLSFSLSKIIVLNLVEDLSLKHYLVPFTFSVALLVRSPCPPVD